MFLLGSIIGQIKEKLKFLNEKYEQVLNQQETIMKRLGMLSMEQSFRKRKRLWWILVQRLVLLKFIPFGFPFFSYQILHSLISLGH